MHNAPPYLLFHGSGEQEYLLVYKHNFMRIIVMRMKEVSLPIRQLEFVGTWEISRHSDDSSQLLLYRQLETGEER
jgi:hypothetical protein